MNKPCNSTLNVIYVARGAGFDAAMNKKRCLLAIDAQVSTDNAVGNKIQDVPRVILTGIEPERGGTSSV